MTFVLFYSKIWGIWEFFSGLGHSIFDIGTLYFHDCFIPNSKDRETGMKIMLGFLPENNNIVDALWNDLINVYFDPKSDDDLQMIEKIAFIIGNIRSMVSIAEHSHAPEYFKKMVVDRAKQILLPNIEEYTEILRRTDDYFA